MDSEPGGRTTTWAALVDLVLPGGCAGCTAHTAPWCAACLAAVGPPTFPVVPGAQPVLAVGRYRGPLRTAVLRYKERGRRDTGAALAALIGPHLAGLPGPAPWLVPAPSRSAAARARGGAHVARLCRRLDGTATADVLRLAGGTADSVGLDARERAANLAGRVRVRAAALPPPGSRVVLVDDVLTTGATLRACCAALSGSGVHVAAALVLCDATARDRAQGRAAERGAAV